MIRLASIVSAVLLALGLVWAARALDVGTLDRERGQRVGEARAQSSASIILDVNGVAVREFDLAEANARAQVNLEYMRSEIAKGTPTADQIQARLSLIEQFGTQNAALASLIATATLEEKATSRGYTPTAEEVEHELAQQRQWIAEGLAPSTEGYIAAVGEETYWSEILPEKLRLQLANKKMRADVLRGVRFSEQARVWAEVERDAVTGAVIKVESESAISPASVEAALAYLDAYWLLSGSVQ